MAGVFVQNVGTVGSSTSTASLVVPVTVNTTAGNLLFLRVAASGGRTITGIADSRGNTWTVDKTLADAGGTTVSAMQCSAPNTTALQSGDSITITLSGTANCAASASEWSGMDISGTRVDTSSSATGASTTAAAGTLTTTTAATVVQVSIACNGTITFTPGAGYTAGASASSAGTVRNVTPEYKILSAAGSESPTATLGATSRTWVGCAVAYKAAGAPPAALSGTAGGFLAAPASGFPTVISSAPISQTVDDFSGTFNTAKWDNYGPTPGPSNVSGRLTWSTDIFYNGVIGKTASNDRFDLSNSSMVAEIQQLPSAATDSWFRFAAYSNEGSWWGFVWNQNFAGTPQIYYQWKSAAATGTVTSGAFTGLASARFWRLRQSGTTMFWDTSPNAITWTNVASVATNTGGPATVPFTGVTPNFAAVASGSVVNNPQIESYNLPYLGSPTAVRGAGGATGSLTIPSTPALLTGTSAGTGTTSGALRATPLLAGASASAGTTTGALTATPLLSGTSAATGATAGALRATPNLTGSTTAAGTTTGALLTTPALAGTTAATGVATGTLTATPALSGTTAAVGATSGTLRTTPNLTGSTAGAGTATGVLTGTPSLTGASTAAGATSGALSATPQLTGNAAGVGATSGTMGNTPLITGAAAGTGSASGSLNVTMLLSGSSIGSGAASGALRATSLLSGSSTATGALAAALTATSQVTGTSSAAGTLSGALSAAAQLTGSTAGIGTVAGALSASSVPPLSGTAAGVGATSGTLRTTPQLQGTLAGVGLATGALKATPLLAGSTAGTGSAAATLRTTAALSGTMSGFGLTNGALKVFPALVGTSAGTGLAVGTLGTPPKLFGTAVGVGSTTGFVNVYQYVHYDSPLIGTITTVVDDGSLIFDADTGTITTVVDDGVVTLAPATGNTSSGQTGVLVDFTDTGVVANQADTAVFTTTHAGEAVT